MNYTEPKQIPDCTIKKPLERIKELAAVIHATNDITVLKNSVELLRIEISRRADKDKNNIADHVLNEELEPLAEIVELCGEIHKSTQSDIINGLIDLLEFEIARYDSRLFNGEELPF